MFGEALLSMGSRLPRSCTVLALLLLFTAFLPCRQTVAHVVDPPVVRQVPTLRLKVDAEHGARATVNNLTAFLSIAGNLEFFEQTPTGERRTLFSGPWKGALRQETAGTFLLTGGDAASGAAYRVTLSKNSDNAVEISLFLTAPSRTSSRPANLSFQIARISTDLCGGDFMIADPTTATDARRIPAEPSPFSERVLMTDKNRVSLQGAFCDMEITDVLSSRTMMVVDCRNVQWERWRSVGLDAEVRRLEPGTRYALKYILRALPPTRPSLLNRAKISGRSVDAFTDPWPFYELQPKEDTAGTGRYTLLPGDVIAGVPSRTPESVLAEELRRLTSLSLPVRLSSGDPSARGIDVEIGVSEGARLPPEGFEIVTTEKKVLIRGADERGCLYGAYALLSRLRKEGKVWSLPSGVLRDWPDLRLRGVCIEIPPNPAVPDIGLFKRYLDAFSRARSNVVVFLHNPPQVRSWLRDRESGPWTKAHMSELARHARSLGMDVWAGLGSAFQGDDFREMEVAEGSNLYNPLNESSYKALFRLLQQVIDVYHPSTFLAGHDEVRGLSEYAARSGRRTADIFAEDVVRIHDWFAARNVKTAIWSDMLLDHETWEPRVGSANGSNPALASGATHLALGQLPRDLILLDWHYGERMDYASIGYFAKQGFGVVGASWHDGEAAKRLAASVQRYGGEGIVATDWGFWSTMSPAATSLYAPLCGWSSRCKREGGDREAEMLAATLRDGVYAETALLDYPMSLSAEAKRVSCDTGGGKGVFGVGPFLDLSGLSSGKQVLAGITFEILPPGPESNCIVPDASARTSPMIDRGVELFQGSLHARAIAFLHTALIEEPQVIPRPIGRYRIEYADGCRETVDVIENWNITDVRSSQGLRANPWTYQRSPDVIIGATIGWRGASAGGVPLNIQVLLWKNPHPEKDIRRIRLNLGTAPPGTRTAVLALTALR